MKQLVNSIRTITKEAEDGNTFECVMVASTIAPELWLQITSDMINLSYPFDEDPAEKLEALGLVLPSDMQPCNWEPQESATWGYVDSDPQEIAAFVLAYLLKVYGSSGSSAHLHIERQEI